MSEDHHHRRRGRPGGGAAAGPGRAAQTRLRNPFAPQAVLSEDRIAAIHDTALRVLEELGLRVLLPEAVALFRAAGARVEADGRTVRIGREIVAAALATAPGAVRIAARDPGLAVDLAPGAMVFHSGAGCPHVSDRLRGRRPGTLDDFREAMRLIAGFDAIHLMGAAVEPQDVAPNLRHYATTLVQLETSAKVPFVYARGRAQVQDCFEMIALSAGETGLDGPRTFTVINTNSPRVLDAPMAEGIIDFARAGQPAFVTPFCLMGAMAPVTVAGALVLQHAEALAGITLSQLARAGAPVLYGAFASNVAMKSGAPAFGTPEHMRAMLVSGQLARHIGLPWRGSSGAAANMADAQGATETTLATMAAVMAGATVTVHAAGWLEGGLTFGFEKFVTDMEVLETLAALAEPLGAGPEELAFDALAEVAPGGHFFGAAHTMARYRTAFREPLVADWSNFGQWTEKGALRADERATEVWRARIAAFAPDPALEENLDAVRAFAARRTAQGGAAPPG
ncbi:MAG: trimethylamine methyltransferase family protein [Rhodobacteraceae bacterium]|nr:trimethylamine methyltransferase family protein [Paracoccaceae bacterium]